MLGLNWRLWEKGGCSARKRGFSLALQNFINHSALVCTTLRTSEGAGLRHHEGTGGRGRPWQSRPVLEYEGSYPPRVVTWIVM